MAIRVMRFARRLRPHVVDPWTLTMIVVAFATGVFVIVWHGESLKLAVEGTNLGWAILVAFGVTYHGDWSTAWRIGAGLIAGAMASMAGLYGSLSVLPATALGVAVGLGVTAAAIALITHMVPRVFSFAGAAVGFGIGIGAARSFPLRPTTPADDLFALMLTTALAVVIGAFGSIALRAAIVWVGVRSKDELGRMRFRPHRVDREEAHVETIELAGVGNGHGRKKARAGR